jgi:alpha-ketoglutarate-dependent taurine dioxygenase
MQKLKTSFLNKEQLPLVIEPKDKSCSLLDLKRILQEENNFFKESLLKYGGLLFRNFPIQNSDDFANVVKSLDTGAFVNYIGGGAPRIKVKEKIYTSTEAPRGIKILLHNEMSFAENYPHHIFFYCDIPPNQGGETFIADGRQVIKSIDESLKNKFRDKGLKYISRYYYKSRLMDLMNKIQRGHKTWIDVFETDNKTEVEANCKNNNIAFHWHKKDWLEISRVRPPVLQHPITKDLVWFNQVHLFDYNPRFLGWLRYIGARLFYFKKKRLVDEARFGDDTPIPRKEIYHILDILDKHSIYFPWQKGDVMALDNILTMHARAPFKGKRRILTIMTKPETLGVNE